MTEMRENLSLFSFWGLLFALTAVTIFVVVLRIQELNRDWRQV